jgi:hypothetical protein
LHALVQQASQKKQKKNEKKRYAENDYRRENQYHQV